MKNLKYILVSSIIIFILCFPAHFMFNILEYNFIAIFFPTNESIFQHMKMVYSCFFIFYLILFIGRRKFKFNNIFISCLISSIICISIFLIIYIPIYLRYGENMIFTFVLLFISIILGQTMGGIFLTKNDYKLVDIIGFILLVIIFFINGYLTFNSIEDFIFWDPLNETYDIVYEK